MEEAEEIRIYWDRRHERGGGGISTWLSYTM